MSTTLSLDFSSGAASSQPLPLLFPCSSLRKETLPSALKGAGLPLQELVSYNTEPHPHLGENIRSCVEGLGGGGGGGRGLCAVFFSPSGVEFALRELVEEARKSNISIKVRGVKTFDLLIPKAYIWCEYATEVTQPLPL